MTMATQALEHSLATLLATNDLVPANLPHLASLLSSQRILQLAEHHEGLHGPLLHRWHLRLVALVAPVNPPRVRQAGFHLAHLSFQASTSLLLDAAKAALTAAVQVLANPKADPDLFLAALELARLVLANSTYHPEWARDNVGPQQVQKLVGALVQAATVEFSDVRPRSPRSPSSARPPPDPRSPLARRSSSPASPPSSRSSRSSQPPSGPSHRACTISPSPSSPSRRATPPSSTRAPRSLRRSTSSRPRARMACARRGGRASRRSSAASMPSQRTSRPASLPRVRPRPLYLLPSRTRSIGSLTLRSRTRRHDLQPHPVAPRPPSPRV